MKTPLILLLPLVLAACATSPVESSGVMTPNSNLQFVDISKFDHELSASLGARDIDKVEVAFYEKVSPNAIPERLQKWITTVDGSGGRVRVEPPAGELVARNPLALLSLFGTLFNGAKTIAKLQQDRMLESAKERDAVISLERNAKGEMVVGKVVFIKRAP